MTYSKQNALQTAGASNQPMQAGNTDIIRESIALHKEDMALTKKTLAADIEGRDKVLEQNRRTIECYEKELRRNDLSEESRMKLIEKIDNARQSSEQAERESREFQDKHLYNSHEKAYMIGVFAFGLLLFAGFRKAA